MKNTGYFTRLPDTGISPAKGGEIVKLMQPGENRKILAIPMPLELGEIVISEGCIKRQAFRGFFVWIQGPQPQKFIAFNGDLAESPLGRGLLRSQTGPFQDCRYAPVIFIVGEAVAHHIIYTHKDEEECIEEAKFHHSIRPEEALSRIKGKDFVIPVQTCESQQPRTEQSLLSNPQDDKQQQYCWDKNIERHLQHISIICQTVGDQLAPGAVCQRKGTCEQIIKEVGHPLEKIHTKWNEEKYG